MANIAYEIDPRTALLAMNVVNVLGSLELIQKCFVTSRTWKSTGEPMHVFVSFVLQFRWEDVEANLRVKSG